MKVVSHARDTPTGPHLHSYKILSKYVYRFSSYGVYKDAPMDFSFKEDKYKKVRVVSLARDMPDGPPLNPFKILLNYQKKNEGVMAC